VFACPPLDRKRASAQTFAANLRTLVVRPIRRLKVQMAFVVHLLCPEVDLNVTITGGGR
jgi:hypothetical protein